MSSKVKVSGSSASSAFVVDNGAHFAAYLWLYVTLEVFLYVSVNLLIEPVAMEANTKPCDVTIAVQHLHRRLAILARLKADAGVKVGVNGGVA